jgi:putative membrane protein
MTRIGGGAGTPAQWRNCQAAVKAEAVAGDRIQEPIRQHADMPLPTPIRLSLDRPGLQSTLSVVPLLSAKYEMNVFDLPPVNATLNGLSTCFIAAGWASIRRDRKRVHITCMLTALICSTIFLACYLTYHFGLLSAVGEGSVEFTAEGWVRPLYEVILITHLILAFTILPLVIMTVIPALRARFDRHRRIGLFTMPIWLYVSISGVIVYFMLYQWFPSTHLEELKQRYELRAGSF